MTHRRISDTVLIAALAATLAGCTIHVECGCDSPHRPDGDVAFQPPPDVALPRPAAPAPAPDQPSDGPVIHIRDIHNPFGMTFADGALWVQDPDGLIFQFDPDTGRQLQVLDCDPGVGRDIVIVGDVIFQPDDGHHTVNKFALHDGAKLEHFRHPGTYPEGIATDGDHLWVTDIEGGGIHKRLLSSPDYPIVSRFASPSPAAHGMTFVDGYLYVAHNPGRVHVVDAHNGRTVAVLPLPEQHVEKNLSDVGFDGTHFWFLFNHDKTVVRAPKGWGRNVARPAR